MNPPIRYLLVTHIPFTRNAAGEPVVDGLWALVVGSMKPPRTPLENLRTIHGDGHARRH